MATFHVPPQNQGQIIETSFAPSADGLVMRVFDRSDGSEYFRLAKWTAKLERWFESVGPWNEEPPSVRWGKKLTKAQALRLLRE